MWLWIGAFVNAYLLGAIPTAYLVVRWLRHLDVRDVGSGNVGATNAVRAAGLRAGLLVFLMDAGKGALAGLLIAPCWLSPATPEARLACGSMAVIGHIAPVFLQFRGGKGVATTIGVCLSLMPAVAGVCLVVWLGSVALWRYVSLGSLLAAAAIPVAQAAFHRSPTEIQLGALLALLIVTRHRTNISRLVQGTEHRVGFGRPSKR